VLIVGAASAVLFQWYPLAIGTLFVAAFLSTAYFVSPDRLERKPLAAEDAGLRYELKTTADELQRAIRERDDARLEATSLKSAMDDKYPRFVGTIWESQWADEPLPNSEVLAVIIMSVTNSGLASTVTNYVVKAKAIHGATLKVDVIWPASFRLFVNHGTDCLDVVENHYIMGRTHGTPVKRGTPVWGIVPCIFHDIRSLKEVDLRTLSVEFADGTGDDQGNTKWWTTQPLSDFQLQGISTPRIRPGLPTIHPVQQGQS